MSKLLVNCYKYVFSMQKQKPPDLFLMAYVCLFFLDYQIVPGLLSTKSIDKNSRVRVGWI